MSKRNCTPHEDRTATEPRGMHLHAVVVSRVTRINDTIRTFRLDVTEKQNGVEFLPGQWLDVHFDGLDKAGGYTVISTPQHARAANSPGSQHGDDGPYLELAVQDAPSPQAQRLWAEEQDVLGMELLVRVGGSYVWPPTQPYQETSKRVIFLAGGVGINPLISMAQHMHETDTMPASVQFLYGTRVRSAYNSSNVLALPELLALSKARPDRFDLQLFFSGHPARGLMEGAVPRRRFEPRRVLDGDVLALLRDPQSNRETVCYVCGPPRMTDHYVDLIRGQDGMVGDRVLCEKWW